MNIIAQLTTNSIKENKKRTIVTVIGVALSCALMIAVGGMFASFQQMMKDIAISRYGDYHDMYVNVPEDSLHCFSDEMGVKSISYGEIEADIEEYFDASMIKKTNNYDVDAEYSAIMVYYKNPQEYQEIRDRIVGNIQKETGYKVRVITNSELLRYEGVMGDTTLTTVLSLAGIVVAIIVFTSVFVIRNSFSISASERTREFGMLRSIGATGFQIRSAMYFEALIIAIAGIILGTIIGVIAILCLVQIINALASEIFLVGDMSGIRVVIPFWIFAIVYILTFVVVFLSCRSSARRAAKIPPIEALRDIYDTKIKNKKLKSSKLIQKYFGIGGVIADKNLRRSSRKYRTTVISLVVSIATFVGLASFLNYGKRAVEMEYGSVSYDIQAVTTDEKNVSDISALPDIDKLVVARLIATDDISVIVLDKYSFAEFAKQVGIKSDDKNTVILNDYTDEQYGSQHTIKRTTDFKPGDTVKINVIHADNETYDPDEKVAYDITITKMTDKWPEVFNNYYAPMYVVSEDYSGIKEFDQTFQRKNYQLFINSKKSNDIEEKIQNIFDKNRPDDGSYYGDLVNNVAQTRRIMNNLLLLISIFLYGFIIVITLIGVTNIFNTITTNIMLRSKEFAMLKSIGMTQKEFNGMIRLESVLYSLKSLLIGLPIGIAISFAIYKALANSVDFGYVFPWQATLVAIAAVVLLVSIIMNYSVKQVSKQNIIETIRNDNI